MGDGERGAGRALTGSEGVERLSWGAMMRETGRGQAQAEFDHKRPEAQDGSDVRGQKMKPSGQEAATTVLARWKALAEIENSRAKKTWGLSRASSERPAIYGDPVENAARAKRDANIEAWAAAGMSVKEISHRTGLVPTSVTASSLISEAHATRMSREREAWQGIRVSSLRLEALIAFYGCAGGKPVRKTHSSAEILSDRQNTTG